MKYAHGAWHVFEADGGEVDLDHLADLALQWRRLAHRHTDAVDAAIAADQSPIIPMSKRRWKGTRTSAATCIQRAQRNRIRRMVARWGRNLAHQLQGWAATRIQTQYRQLKNNFESTVMYIAPNTTALGPPYGEANASHGVYIVPETVIAAPPTMNPQSAYIHQVCVARQYDPTRFQQPLQPSQLSLSRVPIQNCIADSGAGPSVVTTEFLGSLPVDACVRRITGKRLRVTGADGSSLQVVGYVQITFLIKGKGVPFLERDYVVQ